MVPAYGAKCLIYIILFNFHITHIKLLFFRYYLCFTNEETGPQRLQSCCYVLSLSVKPQISTGSNKTLIEQCPWPSGPFNVNKEIK